MKSKISISYILSKLLLGDWKLFFLRFLSLFLSFSIGVFITRFFEIESRGLYSIFTVNTSLGSVFILFGFNEFLLKTLKTNPKLNYAPFFLYCLFFYLIFSLYIIQTNHFLIVKINIIFSSLFSSIILFYRFYYINFNDYIKSEFITILSSMLFLIILISGYAFNLKFINNINTVLFLYNLTLFLVVLIFTNKLHYKFDFKFYNISHFVFSSDFFNVLKFGLFGFVGILSSKFIYLLIQEKAFSQTVALLNVSEIFPALYSSIMLLLSYKVTNTIYICENHFLKQLLINTFLKFLFLLVPFFIVFYFYGEKIISLLYGHDYSISGNLMFIQLFTVFFGLLTNFIVISFLKLNKTYLAFITQFFNILFLYLVMSLLNNIDLKSLLILNLLVSALNFLLNYLLLLFTLNKLVHVR